MATNTDYIKVPYLDYMTVVEKACNFESIKRVYELDTLYTDEAVRAIVGVPKKEKIPTLKVD